MATKHYLSIEFGSGTAYEYSKEPQEGFEQHTGSTGNITYRKYYKKGIYGFLQKAEVIKGKFGEQLELTLQKGEETYFLKIPVFTQNGDVDEYCTSVIQVLPALKKDGAYRIFPYSITPSDGGKYTSRGVSIKTAKVIEEEALDKIEKVYNFLKKGATPTPTDIPALVWKEKMGKTSVTATSKEARTDFLFEKLILGCQSLGGNTDGTIRVIEQKSTPEPQKPAAKKPSAPAKAQAPVNNISSTEADDSDLPF